jgi:hypothetical protein
VIKKAPKKVAQKKRAATTTVLVASTKTAAIGFDLRVEGARDVDEVREALRCWFYRAIGDVKRMQYGINRRI